MEIKIYDGIDPIYGYGLEDLENELKSANGEDVHVKIQSGGGSVFEGLAMYNTLKNYEGKVTTEIVGISASIASIIFLAGSKRIVNEVGFLMIHEAWTMTAGGASELREDAELLDQINSQILDIYQSVTGLDREDLKSKMSKDTYIGPSELLEMGFVTEIKEGLQLVASINNFNTNSLKQTAKEPSMAMSKEEKAEFEALKAENVALKTEQEAQAKLAADKEAEIEKIKAEQDQKVSEAIKAEKERESGILAAVSVPKQLEFAKKLVAEGKDLMSAKVALLDDLNANKELYLKAEATPSIEALVSEAPLASKAEGEVLEASKDELYKEYRALKNQGEYAKAEQFFNDKLK